ncbi:MAG TPA: MlaD family protein [Pseudonocardiaceae bacterium]|jgi:phospholipid/cholesterol/gamma-HCH transport system substrate-binding protein|nr:MlaD family protein [Pseudonocardiaceae bacterium]
MLTRGTKLRVLAFLVVGLTVIVYLGLTYANLGRLVGLAGYYVVKMDVPQGGGIYSDADVTYRGVSVGRVGAINLTATGVEIELDINNSAPQIPSDLSAAVADRSAVGEQYVDLKPNSNSGPYLASGSVIGGDQTTIPPGVDGLLTNLNTLTASVPTQALQTVINELYNATNGQGPNLQNLLDTSSQFVQAAVQNLPQGIQLIQTSQQVLTTQIAETNALTQFSANAALINQQLVQSDGDIRKLIGAVPGLDDALISILKDTNPQLSVLIANLLTTSEVTVTRQPGMRTLLSDLPNAVSVGSAIVRNGQANFGIELTFFNPLPCTAGYGGTPYRNGLDTSPGAPLNTGAACTSPPPGGEVRGSANAPSSGVPAPAQPGSVTLSSLLGLPN